MKKISQSSLKKLVKEKNLEVTRGKIPSKPKKEPEKKVDQTPVIMARSVSTVVDSAVIVAQIAKSMQVESKKKPEKRKWKFTPHRSFDQIIQYITVEEL